MAYSAVNLYLKFESGLIEGMSSYLVTRLKHKPPEQRRLEIALHAKSCTVYIGNLSYYTTEEQIAQHFTLAGMVKRVIMGLNRFDKTFCGFAFVEYYDHEAALNAKRYLHKTRLNGRILKVDVDSGFTHDRMFGRGEDGGQVRDNFRDTFDSDRGGYSLRMKKLEREYDMDNGVEEAPPTGNSPEAQAPAETADVDTMNDQH